MQQKLMDKVQCPNCFGGGLYEVCSVCAGAGEVEDAAGILVCSTCEGLGELRTGDCPLCYGSGVVSRALARLYEADKWVRANEPDWNGDDSGGVTILSKAKWYRNRSLRDSLTQARGVGDFVLLHGSGKEDASIIFGGFSWGYAGEGPNGLVDVLVDAGFFRDRSEGLEWVVRLNPKHSWRLKKSITRTLD